MTLSFDELKALVCLNRAAAARAALAAAALFEQNLLPREVCAQLLSQKILTEEALFPAVSVFDAAKEIERAAEMGISFISQLDPVYPRALKETAGAPPLLYMKGRLIESDQAAVAVVGSRHPSIYGLEQASRLARELALGGVTVVSGLARGVDQSAHEGCLRVPHGRTLAVLGCGVDQIYPREHRRLFDMIAERGAILSEFPLGTEPLARNFPRRNRIISGLSLGVLVVEAHLRSGSLITARLAAEQGREVFAVPGPVDQWTSRGTHQLLREGAGLVENAQDIFEVVKPAFAALVPSLQKIAAAPKNEISAPNQRDFFTENDCASSCGKASAFSDSAKDLDGALLESLAAAAQAPDELIASVRGEAGEVLAALARLEIFGDVVKNRDGRFERVQKGTVVG